ncbi:MAG: lactate racemase domain-containing protein [bacterium]
MALAVERGGTDIAISLADLEALAADSLARLGGNPRRVLLLPPDHTRMNSMAGPITAILYRQLSGKAAVDIMPALGTHAAMTAHELRLMFGEGIPLDRFLVHDWRRDVVGRGSVSGAKLREWSDGRVDYEVAIEVNRRLYAGYDLILSIGQVVPHEVVGMANYTKNIVVGVGGADTINKSHFLGAVCNMERIMGQADTPVRRLFNYGVDTFLSDLPIAYVLTVMQRDHAAGQMRMRGWFAGTGDEPFLKACALSQRVNLELLATPLRKVVVWLDPEEFRSTWLGNKAVYRTRMAIADGGELVVMAPALREFGEDREIDRLIRRYGYRGTEATLAAVGKEAELKGNLSAAAHLIHGSPEGRFTIRYCPGAEMPRAALESVGYASGDLAAMLKRYDPAKMRDGINILPDGEEIFYISNPALGLWALESNFGAKS